MYFTHPLNAKAVTRCLAESRAHAGFLSFQPDTTERTRLPTLYYLFQEVTLLLLPIPKEKAAVAAAASGAQESAQPCIPIVPSLRRNTMGFRSFFPSITPLNPLQHIKLYLRLHRSSPES